MGELSVFIVQLYFIIKKIKASVEDKNWKKKQKPKHLKAQNSVKILSQGRCSLLMKIFSKTLRTLSFKNT